MRKIITFSIILSVVALMSNCSPKVVKNAAKTDTKKEESRTGATNENPAPNADIVKDAQADRSNAEQIQLLSLVNDQRLDAGGKLYATTCNKCHDLHSPGSRSADSWVEIMKVMGPKAKLDVAPYMMISSYLVKNSKG